MYVLCGVQLIYIDFHQQANAEQFCDHLYRCKPSIQHETIIKFHASQMDQRFHASQMDRQFCVSQMIDGLQYTI